ncbi:Chaperone required for the assembly of the F1-ATPase [Tistlia consotensis]|uniref:Chaperone required for the assembly of the F1-ATPase n=1 Tax=Tistlia consotensis USBA 355 TaxID=560819 RepID=A0A1Y6C470_9PROT|nr:ATP12 family protein [Tistlia consotensis]SMF43168.1 Chaperone required for the assembly of the F1-ATPase [Tistlia consotensis USBA 355]SNR42319.1 Chaperone required for the assembly of the F1-ATPase [Tistlia consotensis]
MAEPRKRIYKTVTVARDAGGHLVQLDGRPLRTPARVPLAVPAAGLAEAIAEEWRAQGATLDPSTMPLTALACSTIDLVSAKRAETVEELAGFAEHELLCYRAPNPAELAERQKAVWQPLLDWAALGLDAPLVATEGLASVPQPPDALAALRRAVERQDDWRLAALALAVRVSGSLVVGLALAEGRLDATGAFEAAELDESFTIERWGEDPEAAKRRRGLLAELAAAERFLRLLDEAAGPDEGDG